jgi:hypothetical protein
MDELEPGQEWPEFEMIVEVGKIREFARATKSASPDHQGWAPIAPTTFLTVASLWMGPENSPLAGDLNLERVLHGAEEFIFHGKTPAAGDRLVGRARITDVYEKQGRRGGSMQFIEMVHEYRDPDGRLVAEVRSTMIETAAVVGGG